MKRRADGKASTHTLWQGRIGRVTAPEPHNPPMSRRAARVQRERDAQRALALTNGSDADAGVRAEAAEIVRERTASSHRSAARHRPDGRTPRTCRAPASLERKTPDEHRAHADPSRSPRRSPRTHSPCDQDRPTHGTPRTAGTSCPGSAHGPARHRGRSRRDRVARARIDGHRHGRPQRTGAVRSRRGSCRRRWRRPSSPRRPPRRSACRCRRPSKRSRRRRSKPHLPRSNCAASRPSPTHWPRATMRRRSPPREVPTSSARQSPGGPPPASRSTILRASGSCSTRRVRTRRWTIVLPRSRCPTGCEASRADPCARMPPPPSLQWPVRPPLPGRVRSLCRADSARTRRSRPRTGVRPTPRASRRPTSRARGPGFSEHQSGLAGDVVACAGGCGTLDDLAATAQGQWIVAHSWEYGWVTRYEDGYSPITGYSPEPWHLRYIGPELARAYHDGGWHTLEEFFGLPAAPTYL